MNGDNGLGPPPEILDCTIRDGGYANNWDFSPALVRDAYRALSKSGVDYVELGFLRDAATPGRGPWHCLDEALLREVTDNIQGARVCAICDFGTITAQNLPPRAESVVELVRVAAHKKNLRAAVELLAEIRGRGYRTSLQCMGYSTYSAEEKREAVVLVRDSGLDYVYIADSYGAMLPFQVRDLLAPFLELPGIKVGFHPHNNLQMTFANTLEALAAGVNVLDCTIYGMGRGAGNLHTEILLAYLQRQGRQRYNVVPILTCIQQHFLAKKGATPWGYQLPYMISGMFDLHPNYSRDLLAASGGDMEAVWTAMGYLRELNPVGYQKELADRLVQFGFVSHPRPGHAAAAAERPEEPAPPVPYAGRHRGRDILVLANGPSLRTHREAIAEFIRRYEPVVLGANYLAGLFVPDYHAFVNLPRFTAYHQTVDPASRLLVGANILGQVRSDRLPADYEVLRFLDRDADFSLCAGVIGANCRSVSVLLAGVALVMGAGRIFVAGMDGYLNKDVVRSTLFYDETFDIVEHASLVEQHRKNEQYLRQIDRYFVEHGGEGIHILTPTTHTAFHKGLENYI